VLRTVLITFAAFGVMLPVAAVLAGLETAALGGGANWLLPVNIGITVLGATRLAARWT
jgi:hypothetical protein